MPVQSTPSRLGLRANRYQFWLLVLINGFVGGMVGLERTLFPDLASQVFGLDGYTVILSFIMAFGLAKAISNYFAGRWRHRIGAKRLLVLGWILAIPVPFLLMYAGSWTWIVAANILLGIHQGLAWSTTVIMKVDLVGPRQRGLAMGLNEFAGYLAVAVMAYLAAVMADRFGLRPVPFSLGIGLSLAGLFLTVLFVRDTRQHVHQEAEGHSAPRLEHRFWETTWANPQLGPVTLAGMVNNLNDGMVWGILPVLLTTRGLTTTDIGWVGAAYPAVWGISQIGTGLLADRWCKRDLLVAGMLVQGAVIMLVPAGHTLKFFLVMAVLLGLGTALVYPTFLAAIADASHPLDRSESLGIFRFWRDLGYVIGALLTGLVADWFSVETAILTVGLLTVLSGLTVRFRMVC